VSDGGELAGGLVAEVTPSNGAAQAYPMRESDARWHLTLDGIPPGLYRVRVRGAKGGGGAPTPVRELFEVVGR
jgi:hypothetical protein